MAQSERRLALTRRIPIKTILLAAALSASATGAYAQYGAPGSFAPFTFNEPAAAAASSAVSAQPKVDDPARCYWDSHGRGGGRYQCPDQPAGAPQK